MATSPKKQKTAPKQAAKKGLNETQRWVLGVAVFVFGLFLLTAVVSYYFTWQHDQNFAQWGNMWQTDGDELSNVAGKTGAVLANYVVGEWFGFFGVVIPAVIIIIGLRIISGRRNFLSKYIRISLITMILGSLTLGLIFSTNWTVFGTGPGGAHGIFMSELIRDYIGTVGAGLVLLFGWILLGVYVNSRRTMDVVNKVGRSIYDGGAKVGGAVIDHASELVARKDETVEDDEELYDVPWETDEEEEEIPAIACEADNREVYVEEPVEEPVAEPVAEPEPVAAAVVPERAKTDDKEFEITDSRRNVEEEQAVTPAAAKPDDGAVEWHGGSAPQSGPQVVMLGEEAGEFVVGGAAAGANAARQADDSRYAGGVGIYAVDGEPSRQAATQNRTAAVHGGERGIIVEDGPFEVVDTTPGRTLSAGGIVEAEAKGGVTPDNEMKVVQAGHADAQAAEIDDSLYDPTKELSKYQKPPVELLEDHSVDVQVTEEEIYENKNQIVRTLENFGIKIDKIKATIGPTVTLYEIIPAPGVKISKIKNLEDDIALSLKALGIRIIAPMPGKGTIGIEVPNKDKEIVSMYSVVKTMKFQESTYELPVVLGKTISNETFMIDLAKMPHLLVAGATGQGKSVGLNAVITSLLYKKHPAELKFVMVDPKRVELSLYSKLEKHFLAKMESEEDAILTDTQKVVYTLNALCNLMSERYDLLRMAEVKKISEYNDKFLKRRLNPNKGHKFMPYIVVVIDEFADMIMTAGREVEAPITRLAQLARAVGIHLIIATQRPDVKVITGLIKANFPARIAFRVTSMIDSRTILDQPGANHLIGRGDMLMSINGEVTRVQCAFIDTPEIDRIVEFISNQKGYPAAYDLPDYQPEGGDTGAGKNDLGKLDDMFGEVARAVVQAQEFSTSWIQRNYSIGYNRAGRITDQLEKAGIIGRANGSKPREVLIMDVMTLEDILARLGA